MPIARLARGQFGTRRVRARGKVWNRRELRSVAGGHPGVGLARCFKNTTASETLRDTAPMAVAKHARRRLGLVFRQDSRARARPDAHHPCVTFQRITAKNYHIADKRRSMSDSKQSVDPLEVGQGEAPQRHCRAPGAPSHAFRVILVLAVRAVFRGGGPLSRLALRRPAASR